MQVRSVPLPLAILALMQIAVIGYICLSHRASQCLTSKESHNTGLPIFPCRKLSLLRNLQRTCWTCWKEAYHPSHSAQHKLVNPLRCAMLILGYPTCTLCPNLCLLNAGSALEEARRADEECFIAAKAIADAELGAWELDRTPTPEEATAIILWWLKLNCFCHEFPVNIF